MVTKIVYVGSYSLDLEREINIIYICNAILALKVPSVLYFSVFWLGMNDECHFIRSFVSSHIWLDLWKSAP